MSGPFLYLTWLCQDLPMVLGTAMAHWVWLCSNVSLNVMALSAECWGISWILLYGPVRAPTTFIHTSFPGWVWEEGQRTPWGQPFPQHDASAHGAGQSACAPCFPSDKRVCVFYSWGTVRYLSLSSWVRLRPPTVIGFLCMSLHCFSCGLFWEYYLASAVVMCFWWGSPGRKLSSSQRLWIAPLP